MWSNAVGGARNRYLEAHELYRIRVPLTTFNHSHNNLWYDNACGRISDIDAGSGTWCSRYLRPRRGTGCQMTHLRSRKLNFLTGHSLRTRRIPQRMLRLPCRTTMWKFNPSSPPDLRLNGITIRLRSSTSLHHLKQPQPKPRHSFLPSQTAPYSLQALRLPQSL